MKKLTIEEMKEINGAQATCGVGQICENGLCLSHLYEDTWYIEGTC